LYWEKNKKSFESGSGIFNGEFGTIQKIDEKEKKLSELESELEKRKNGLKDGNSDINNPNYDFDSSIIDMLTETNYLDKNIFELNKKIEEKFIINYEDYLKIFYQILKIIINMTLLLNLEISLHLTKYIR